MTSLDISSDLAADASFWVRFGIALLSLLVAFTFVLGVAAARKNGAALSARAPVLAAAGILLWLCALAVVARTGVLLRFEQRPPPLMLMMAVTIGLATYTGSSRLGRELARNLPLGALVGFHAFRLPLELVMHRAADEGVMPGVMSYSGYNFDIVSGTTALALGLWLSFGRPPLWLVALWNALGFALLLAIGTIAILATPLFAAFGSDQLNVWVGYFPFVWLPGILVGAALLGHILVLRRLLIEYRGRSQPSPAAA